MSRTATNASTRVSGTATNATALTPWPVRLWSRDSTTERYWQGRSDAGQQSVASPEGEGQASPAQIDQLPDVSGYLKFASDSVRLNGGPR